MRRLSPLIAAAALGGCAVAPPPAPPVQDPYQWHVVSVTPVQRMPGGSSRVEYTSEPLSAGYAAAPVYGPAPVYVPAPVYAPAPAYYYPPVTIGLDFVFGFGRHWGGRAHHRRR